jgi:hypothetical protein
MICPNEQERSVSSDIAVDTPSPQAASALVEHLRNSFRSKSTDVVGDLRVIANRRSYFLRKACNLEGWNLVRGAYTMTQPVNVEALRQASYIVAKHHDGLRLRASFTDGVWAEEIVQVELAAPFVSLRRQDEKQLARYLTDASADVQRSQTFSRDLFHVVHVWTPQGDFVFFVIHHLLCDAYSSNLVIQDFFAAYDAFRRGNAPALPGKTTSYRDYCIGSQAYWMARSSKDMAFWRGLPWDQVRPLLPHFPDQADANIERFTVTKARPTTLNRDRIRSLQRITGWSAAELILGAIARAYCRWTGQEVLHIALVLHGRESFLAELDLSRTVGWISETVPILLRGNLPLPDLLREARVLLRQAIFRGKSYGVLRYQSPDFSELKAHPDADVSLNLNLSTPRALYSPEIFDRDPAYKLKPETAGSTKRVFLLSGGTYFDDAGNLVLSWDFSRKLFQKEKVSDLLDSCLENLCGLLEIIH